LIALGAPQTPGDGVFFADLAMERGHQCLSGRRTVFPINDQIDHSNDQFAHFPRRDYTSF
jgi:hypothetical protein